LLESEFEEFVKSNKSRLKGLSDTEKIRMFIDWCNKYNIEELILRLSADGKGVFDAGYFLDFTTSGLLIRKKTWSRKLVDPGYIAGMAPLPYRLICDKLKVGDISKRTLAQASNIIELKSDDLTKYITYSQIKEIRLRPGVETRVTNMFGSTLRQNFISIKIADSSYGYSLPVGKNGSYDKIYFWLSEIIPVDVSPF
jgi:hypothetical protein